MFLALTFGQPQAVAGEMENYTFINSLDDLEDYARPDELTDAPAYSNRELKDQSLEPDNDDHIVISFKQLAIWLTPQSDWSSQINTSQRDQREALEKLDETAKLSALNKALTMINVQSNAGVSQTQLQEIAAAVNIDSLLDPAKGYTVLDPRKRNRDGFSNSRQCIVSSYYFRFKRAQLFDVIQPSPITPELVIPELGSGQFISKDTYALSYERTREIPRKIKDKNRQAAWQESFDDLVQALAQEAFKEGVKRTNNSLPAPLSNSEIVSFTENLNYGDYIEVGHIERNQIERKFVTGHFDETLHLQITFLFARDNFLNELSPPPEKISFSGPQINPGDFPSDQTYVVKFDHQTFPVKTTRKAAFNSAIEDLARAAFEKAVIIINEQQRNKQEAKEINEFIQKHLENYVRGEEQQNFQLYTQNYDIQKQEIRRLGTKETLHLGVYFYFDKKILGDALRPPLEIIPLDRNIYADSEGRRLPLSSAATLVVPFELAEYRIPQDVEDREIARQQSYNEAIENMAKQSLKMALLRVNSELDKSSSVDDIDRLMEKLESDYRNYTRNREITHQVIKRRGSVTRAEEILQLTVYFYFDRLVLKDLIQPTERSIIVELDTDDLLRMDVPASDDETFVAVFRDEEVEVPSDVQDKELARKRAARHAVEDLKLRAFQQAAEDINHQLAQPMDSGEFKRAINKTSKNFKHYVVDFKWIDPPQVITRGDYSTERERLRLSLYFQVDRKALRKALVSERAITLVAKYRTYVELYWNVPGKFEDLAPELIKETVATVVENIEDHFSQQDYEIVEFENIQGELIRLLAAAEGSENFKAISEDDLYSKDQYTRLKSNLALRCISNWNPEGTSWKAQQGSQSQFEFGKRILADYADLLIGVTINAIDASQDGQQVMLRLTINATLFERGEWIKLASSDAARSLPYEPGNMNLIIEGSKKLSRQLAADLEPKIKHKLARRKAAEAILTETEQVFIVVFKDASKEIFTKIKRRLMDGTRWVYQGTDVPNRTVRIAYEGSIDNFADRIEMFLSGAGLEVGLPEYASSQRRIIFEVDQ